MDFIILAEIILSYIFIKNSFFVAFSNNYIVILILIIYLLAKIVFYINFAKTVNKIAIVLAFIFLLAGLINQQYLMSVFFPITCCQLIYNALGNKKALYLILLMPLAIIPPSMMDTYIIIAVFSFVVELGTSSSNRIVSRQKDELYSYRKNQKKLDKKIKEYQQDKQMATYQIKLEERNKLSQQLHDEIGHNLVGNIMKLEATKTVMQVDSERSLTMLQEVIENLRIGMDRIREILKKVKPERSSVNIASIQSIIQDTRGKCGCNIILNYNSDISCLSQYIWQAIITNTKETLTNMIKYSGATECTIDFTRLNKLYRVRIVDNGVGCTNIVKGLGLRGIDDRMAVTDGNTIFDGSDGFSTTMIFDIGE